MAAYPHLMSPIRLGNTVVKSRIMFPNALPHFQQGPENYPADPIITFYSQLAKNGAGIVLYHHLVNKDQRNSPNRDGRHFPMYDEADYGVQNYICQLTDCIHYYGGLAAVDLFYEMGRDLAVVEMKADDPNDPMNAMAQYLKMLSEDEEDFDVNAVATVFGMGAKRAFTRQDMDDFIEAGIKEAKFLKNMGFNCGHVEVARYSLLGSFLSPTKNTRTDEYGGPLLENRMRFPLETLRRVKEALGDDFPIIIECTLQEDYGSPSIEEFAQFLKAAEPYVDLLHVRQNMLGNGYQTSEADYLDPYCLKHCQKLKDLGVKTPICAWTGFNDPALMDKAIADGKIDMVSVGRMFIANPNLGELLEEGRGDDIAPCVKCNKCHGLSLEGDWVSACTVNPQLGLYARIHRMIEPPRGVKRIAVIGGGLAGMYCAKTCALRGHNVTLFEATDELGGQGKCFKYPDFKWPMRQFIDFLVYQVNKQGVEVRLNTKATPEMIQAEGFDAVFACVGAVPKKPDIPGAENAKWNTISLYGKLDEIGQTVVVIGGSESATEAAIYLARAGKAVTLITRSRECAHDGNPIHWKEYVQAEVKNNANITFLPLCKTTKIEAGSVCYTDKDGQSHTIACDDVVAAGGMQPLQEEAMAFCNSAPYFRMLGDGKKVADVRHAVRDAFAAASQI